MSINSFKSLYNYYGCPEDLTMVSCNKWLIKKLPKEMQEIFETTRMDLMVVDILDIASHWQCNFTIATFNENCDDAKKDYQKTVRIIKSVGIEFTLNDEENIGSFKIMFEK